MKFRKKPVVVEALQFTYRDKNRVFRWASEHQMNIYPSIDENKNPIIRIPTLEGEMTASINDWVIREINGEFYPCKPDIFEKTYEPDYKEILEVDVSTIPEGVTVEDVSKEYKTSAIDKLRSKYPGIKVSIFKV